ncbi:Trehalose/maltose import ATP-binding protein MalK [uncultured archaeon]|nr:Trehalose/maltose import ATP-binding protein MalK [uncultured archaeon]
MGMLVEAEGITKSYPRKVTLYNFSLTIKEGEILGLLGPNGAGKSTFIRILTGLEKPDAGRLQIFGKQPDAASRRLIGVAPQDNAIYPLLTCMENLLYFGSLYSITGEKARRRADRLLNELGLADKKNISVAYLSGGMKRRLNLACALMHEPKLIILDEPTAGLDPSTRIGMWKMVAAIVKETGASLLLTTHYMEEAEALCNHIAFVNAGQVVAEGTPDALKKLAGKEIARVRSIPGDYARLQPSLQKIKGIDSMTITEHGIVIEADDMPPKINQITAIFKRGSENIVEFAVSKPSLEDVFLKLTGAQLKGGVKIEPAK